MIVTAARLILYRVILGYYASFGWLRTTVSVKHSVRLDTKHILVMYNQRAGTRSGIFKAM